MTTEPTEPVTIQLPLSAWRRLCRFCAYRGFEPREYATWLVMTACQQQRLPEPSVRDSTRLQHFDEA